MVFPKFRNSHSVYCKLKTLVIPVLSHQYLCILAKNSVSYARFLFAIFISEFGGGSRYMKKTITWFMQILGAVHMHIFEWNPDHRLQISTVDWLSCYSYYKEENSRHLLSYVPQSLRYHYLHLLSIPSAFTLSTLLWHALLSATSCAFKLMALRLSTLSILL